jgi:tRNA pseudouridine38-40 synthase
MPRLKLVIAYRGSNYHGWQAQPTPPTWNSEPPPEGQGIPTVQEAVARAAASVVGHPVELVGSSRTDAGVHAKGQVAHFDTTMDQIPLEGMRRAINARIPSDILVRSIEVVPDHFDAIRSTLSKRYQYFIWNQPDRPPFLSDLVWHRWQPLDVEAMAAAAKHFVGTHDFTSFARPGHGRGHCVRTIYNCTVGWRAPKMVIGVEGSGFLWNMVRIIVGTLVEVGLRRYGPDEIPRILAAKTREASGPTAPPHGLYLQWIKLTYGPPIRGVRPALATAPAGESLPGAANAETPRHEDAEEKPSAEE